jgi:DNA-directed RNA polymerase sigma subunit (sigma70/sigma32)
VTVKAIANKATSRGRAKRGDKVTARVVAAGTSALASTVDRADLDMLELKRSLLESQWALPSLEENEDSMPSTSGRDFESIGEDNAPDLKASAKKSRSRQKKVSKSVQTKIKSRSSNLPGPARRRRLQSQKERMSAQGEPVAMFSSARLKQSSEVARRGATARAEFSFDESLSLFEECLNTHQLLTPDEEKYLCKKVHDGQQLRAAKERLEHALEREATLEEWAAQVELEDMGELVRRIRQADSAKEKLVVSNLRLVISVAKNYCSYGLPLVDLVQEGTLGLMRGIERF